MTSIPAPPPPPPPAPPVLPPNPGVNVVTKTSSDARNALFSDIQKGVKLKKCVPNERNVQFLDACNGDTKDDPSVSGGLKLKDDVKCGPFPSALHAELTNTLKRRKSSKATSGLDVGEEEPSLKEGIRTFDPNILKSHVPQPTGLKISHASPSFKVSQEKVSPTLPLKKKADEIIENDNALKEKRVALTRSSLSPIEKKTQNYPILSESVSSNEKHGVLVKSPQEGAHTNNSFDKVDNVSSKPSETKLVQDLEKCLKLKIDSFPLNAQIERKWIMTPSMNDNVEKTQANSSPNAKTIMVVDRTKPKTEKTLKILKNDIPSNVQNGKMSPTTPSVVNGNQGVSSSSVKGIFVNHDFAPKESKTVKLKLEISYTAQNGKNTTPSGNDVNNKFSTDRVSSKNAQNGKILTTTPSINYGNFSPKNVQNGKNVSTTPSIKDLDNEFTSPSVKTLKKQLSVASQTDIISKFDKKVQKIEPTSPTKKEMTRSVSINSYNRPTILKINSIDNGNNGTVKKIRHPTPNFTVTKTSTNTKQGKSPKNSPTSPKSKTFQKENITFDKPTISSLQRQNSNNNNTLPQKKHTNTLTDKRSNVKVSVNNKKFDDFYEIPTNFERKQQISFAKDSFNAKNNYKDTVKTIKTSTVKSDLFFNNVNLANVKLEIDTNTDNVIKVVPK